MSDSNAEALRLLRACARALNYIPRMTLPGAELDTYQLAKRVEELLAQFPPEAPQAGPIRPGTAKTQCWKCQHMREVPGNAHIRCAKPDENMTGDEHGIRNGWFLYPLIFDPIWRTRECANHEERLTS